MRRLPRMPCGRATRPMTMAAGSRGREASVCVSPAAMGLGTDVLVLFDDLENRTLSPLGRVGAQDGAHGPCRAALLADDLYEILVRDLQLQNRGLLNLDVVNLHCIRIIDQRLGDILD